MIRGPGAGGNYHRVYVVDTTDAQALPDQKCRIIQNPPAPVARASRPKFPLVLCSSTTRSTSPPAAAPAPAPLADVGAPLESSPSSRASLLVLVAVIVAGSAAAGSAGAVVLGTGSAGS